MLGSMRSRLRLVAALVAIVAVVAGMSWLRLGAAEERRSDSFYSAILLAGSEIEHFVTLSDMMRRSDAVVVGRYTAMKATRVFGDPEHDNAAYYVEGTLAVEEIIYQRSSGELPTRLRVESATFEQVLVPLLVGSYPTERAIFFLRHNAVTAQMAGRPIEEQQAEDPFWHVVTSEGVLRDFRGTVSATGSESTFIQALDGSSTDAVLAQLRQLALTPALSE